VLLGDACYRNVIDRDFFLADEIEQQIKRPLEHRELDFVLITRFSEACRGFRSVSLWSSFFRHRFFHLLKARMEFRIANFELRIANLEPRTADCRFRIEKFEIRNSKSEIPNPLHSQSILIARRTSVMVFVASSAARRDPSFMIAITSSGFSRSLRLRSPISP